MRNNRRWYPSPLAAPPSALPCNSTTVAMDAVTQSPLPGVHITAKTTNLSADQPTSNKNRRFAYADLFFAGLKTILNCSFLVVSDTAWCSVPDTLCLAQQTFHLGRQHL